MSVLIQKDIALKSFNTLALPSTAAFYCEIFDANDIAEALAFASAHQLPFLVLGEGSNVILAKDYQGLVLHIKTTGMSYQVVGDTVIVDVAAGENWHQFVKHTLSQSWYGLENLTLIPGTVGAAPIQNIGAYGAEVSQAIVSVTGWSVDTQSWLMLTNKECEFSYRDSVFKNKLKDSFVIANVRFSLSLVADPIIHYPPLRDRLQDSPDVNPVMVAQHIEAIRKEKLPDPSTLPNVGSFFKNPIISAQEYKKLQSIYPSIPGYVQGDEVKIPAAWLIDQAGWKGYRDPHVGIHDKQALVLVNHDHGNGDDVLALAKRICEDILQRYTIRLEIEPRIYA